MTFGAAPDLEPCAAEAELVKQLALFPETVVQAAEKYEPSLISRFLLDAAKLFNKFYLECKIMQAEGDVRAFRLALTEATLTTLKNGLGLLGIGVPEKM